MEIFTRKGRGRPRKPVPDAAHAQQGADGPGVQATDGADRGTRTPAQAKPRRPSERDLAVLKMLMTGQSVRVKR